MAEIGKLRPMIEMGTPSLMVEMGQL